MLYDCLTNVVALLPVPVLLRGIFGNKVNGFVPVWTGIVLFLLIEVIQSFAHRGICDIDDFLMNSIGVILGALVARFCIKNKRYHAA